MTTVCLRLFIAGDTVSARRARAALAEIESRLISARGPGAAVSEVIDVLATPDIAARDDVFATPTIIRLSPGPSLRVFGDLSSAEQIMATLEIAPPPFPPDAILVACPVTDSAGASVPGAGHSATGQDAHGADLTFALQPATGL